MTLIKRIITSITRRKSKSLILSLVFLCCGILISGALTISTSLITLRKNIVEELGANIVIVNNNKLENNRYYDYLWQPDIFAEERYNYDKRVTQIFEKASMNDEVSYANCVYSLFFDEVPLSNEKTLVRQQTEEEFEYIQKIGLQSPIYGITNADFSKLNDGEFILVEGRTFTEDEMQEGANVLIVRKDFYILDSFCPILEKELVYDNVFDFKCTRNVRNVNVGDIVTLKANIQTDDGKIVERKIDYEIIGLYIENNIEIDDLFIYAPYKSLENEYLYRINQLRMNPNTAQGKFYASLWEIKSKNPETVDGFAKSIQMDLESAGLIEKTVISSAEAYEAVASPIESMNSIINIIFFVSIISTIAIVSIVNLLFIKERKHEIGIYYSMGEKKSKIISQIVLEILIIGLISFSLSLLVSNSFSDTISNEMLNIQVNKQNAIIEEKLEGFEGIVIDDISSQIIVREYDVALTFESILLIYFISTGTILVSTILPVAYALKMKPKEIML